jgi:RNA polymerase sigma-32 factor
MTAYSATLPVLAENGLSSYIASIKKFPMLTHEEETTLANKWIESEDVEAAHSLVTSHLRLVVKMAQSFRGYGLPITDVIAEGNMGLMQAVKRFDPDKGFRLSTYAMWWIKASMNEYVLRSWSMVKMGTTASQKKLFYNLRKVKNQITGAESRNLLPSEISQIADDLSVPERDVIEMNDRLYAHDSSLNARASHEDGDSAELGDFFSDDAPSQEIVLAESQELNAKRAMFATAMQGLNEREQDIITKRKLQEPAATLETLSGLYSVSKERIRQIESRAMEKLQQAVLTA